MNSNAFSVEETTHADAEAVETLLDLSFGLSRRAKSSYRLREGNTAIPGLSLVVRDAEVGLSGTISFWPLKIGEAGTDAVLLGPLAVHPLRQNLGIGLALMREGIARAEKRGHKLMLLVGDAPYYARVGFRKLPHDLLLMPGPVDPDRFLYLELEPGALDPARGLVLPPHRFREKTARSSRSASPGVELVALQA
ncbi:MAG: N-acetyltransferase [Rhizobiales bacterium]|nr:N-acetyltransferase [Hyphomicrobiales bacterium]